MLIKLFLENAEKVFSKFVIFFHLLMCFKVFKDWESFLFEEVLKKFEIFFDGLRPIIKGMRRMLCSLPLGRKEKVGKI